MLREYRPESAPTDCLRVHITTILATNPFRIQAIDYQSIIGFGMTQLDSGDMISTGKLGQLKHSGN